MKLNAHVLKATYVNVAELSGHELNTGMRGDTSVRGVVFRLGYVHDVGLSFLGHEPSTFGLSGKNLRLGFSR